MVSRAEENVRLHGENHFDRFLEECAQSGFASAFFEGARAAGPLATFEGTESWVDHPYGNGCALIGDAAATSDPAWGQGLSSTLRDARELRDALLANTDWDAAGHAYAFAHDRYYRVVHSAVALYTKVFLERSAEAEAVRARVLPQLATDPTALPDTLISGPDEAAPTAAHLAPLAVTI